MHLCISFPEMFCYDFLNHITVHLNAVCCVLLYAVCYVLCCIVSLSWTGERLNWHKQYVSIESNTFHE